MGSYQGVTEITVFDLRDGLDLENATSGGTTTGQALIRLMETMKSQPGFLQQYWGHQVEDPNVFVWSVDWKSLLEAIAFTASDERKSLATEFGQLLDLGKTAPLKMYARFNTNPSAAFRSGVTEIALYTLPLKDYTEETRNAIDKGLDLSSMEAIKKFGAGGATGWVLETQNDAEPDGHTIALIGVYGYPTVNHHRRWRDSPEHAQVMKEMEAGSPEDIDMRSATVPGGGLFLPGRVFSM